MTKPRLYVVHGMGPDAVGLVGRITAAIARHDGNILDLRQDVLHGLFTIYMVVDLTKSKLERSAFEAKMQEIAQDTELNLAVREFQPEARSPQKQNLLMILIGKDRPGIIASSSEMLGKYLANIELAQTIGREGVFLMELLTDVSHVTIPVENLQRTIHKNMEALDIKAVFQDEHVFNKRKRILLFHVTSSFIDSRTVDEIIEQTELRQSDFVAAYSGHALLPSARSAVAKLDGVPCDTLETVLGSISPSKGSMELIQTLKVMGYKIALVSTGLGFFTEHLRSVLDLDYAYGIPHEVDDDARTMGADLVTDGLGSHNVDAIIAHLRREENVDQEDITIITDAGCTEPPGLRIQFNLEVLLECFNQRILSKENMIGLLGSFGTPKLD